MLFRSQQIKQHKSAGVLIVCHFLPSLRLRDKWHVSWFNDFIGRLSLATKPRPKSWPILSILCLFLVLNQLSIIWCQLYNVVLLLWYLDASIWLVVIDVCQSCCISFLCRRLLQSPQNTYWIESILVSSQSLNIRKNSSVPSCSNLLCLFLIACTLRQFWFYYYGDCKHSFILVVPAALLLYCFVICSCCGE